MNTYRLQKPQMRLIVTTAVLIIVAFSMIEEVHAIDVKCKSNDEC